MFRRFWTNKEEEEGKEKEKEKEFNQSAIQRQKDHEHKEFTLCAAPETTRIGNPIAQTPLDNQMESLLMKMVHCEALDNTTKALYAPFSLLNFSWSLKGTTSWVTETRNVYVLNEVGEMLSLQLVFSEPGWPIPSVSIVSACYFDARQAGVPVGGNGQWITIPRLQSHKFAKKDILRGLDGHVFESTNHSASKMIFSRNKTGVAINQTQVRIIGPSTSPEHDPHGSRLVEGINGGDRDSDNDTKKNYAKDSLKLSYRGNVLSFDLIFEPLCSGVSFGGGKIEFGVERNDGEISMRFIPCGKIQGMITVDDVPRAFSGLGLILHQFQGIRPNLAISRSWLNLFVSDKDAQGQQTILFMWQITTPTAYGSVTINYGTIYGDDRLIVMCQDGKITTFDPKLDPGSGYYVPSKILLEWSGVTIDGDPFSATCTIQPRILVERFNPLEQLPYVVRKIVESFFTRPYLYLWTNRSEVTIKMRGNCESISGWVFTELSILGGD